MPQRLRGAIIGCGYFAQFQLQAWKRMEDVELVAATDLDPERARAAAPHAYTDGAEMLDREQLDFVDIATRPASHLELVRQTLGRGIPTICQKPMASTWEEAREMARLAVAAKVPLVIHENWRWQPWYREARLLIEDGAIGKPVSYCFRTRQRDGVGESAYTRQPYFREMPRLLIYETMVHHIDTARFLFGPIDSLYARIRRHNFESIDLRQPGSVCIDDLSGCSYCFGLDQREWDVGLVIEDVVGPLGLTASDQLAANDDAALGEAHLLADLRHLIPTGQIHCRGNKLGADVTFAEEVLVHYLTRVAFLMESSLGQSFSRNLLPSLAILP